MQITLASIFFVICALPAAVHAQASFTNTPDYKRCTALAANAPEKGIDFANAQLVEKGKHIGALHCRAMAQFTLGNFHDSAKDLAGVYAMVENDQLSLRSYITRQAARALSKAGDTDRALASLQRELLALQEAKYKNKTVKERLSADLLLDRAQLFAGDGKHTLAIQELDHAVSLVPNNEAILLSRAQMFAKVGANAQATRDLEAILKTNPRHAKARSLLKGMHDENIE